MIKRYEEDGIQYLSWKRLDFRIDPEGDSKTGFTELVVQKSGKDTEFAYMNVALFEYFRDCTVGEFTDLMVELHKFLEEHK